MREIMFRGLSDPLGYMVHGSYLYEPKVIERVVYEHWIVRDDGFKYAIRLKNSHTIGQYTGLNDENGIQIYEGDIVKVSFWDDYLKIVSEMAIVKFDGTSFILSFSDDKWDYFSGAQSVKVIGNIHQNPELLEGDA